MSSNSDTMYASVASCNATIAVAWNRKSFLKSPAISRTNRWNGSFLISNSVDFWYRLISLSATVPGRNRLTFLTPPVDGADLRAALVANCFLGAFPPVDFLAVCLVRAILTCCCCCCCCPRCQFECRFDAMLLDKCGSRDVAQCPTLKPTFGFVVSPQFAPRCSLVARSRRGPARLDREQQQKQQEERESHRERNNKRRCGSASMVW